MKTTRCYSYAVSPLASRCLAVNSLQPLSWRTLPEWRPVGRIAGRRYSSTGSNEPESLVEVVLQKQKSEVKQRQEQQQQAHSNRTRTFPAPQQTPVGKEISKLISEGKLGDTLQLFKSDPNVDGACALIKAHGDKYETKEAFEVYDFFLEHLRRKGRTGRMPLGHFFSEILNACVISKDYQRALPILPTMRSLGVPFTRVLFSFLSLSAMATGDKATATELYQALLRGGRSKFAWISVIDFTQLMSAFIKAKELDTAMEILELMKKWSVYPNLRTFTVLINGCIDAGHLAYGKMVHGQLKARGLVPDKQMGNALIWFYGRNGELNEAIQVFAGMQDHSFNTLIAIMNAYLLNGQPLKAAEVADKIVSSEIKIKTDSMVTLLRVCASVPDLALGRRMHQHALDNGMDKMELAPMLITMYGRCGQFEEAMRAFETAIADAVQADPGKDTVTRIWNAMILVCGQHNKADKALKLLDKMIEWKSVSGQQVAPTPLTFLGVLGACAEGGKVQEGLECMSQKMPEYDVVPNVLHYNCVVDLLGRAGLLNEAEKATQTMAVEPNDATWIILAANSRLHNDNERAERALANLAKLEKEEKEQQNEEDKVKKREAELLLGDLFALVGGRRWDDTNLPIIRMVREMKGKEEADRTWVECCGGVYSFASTTKEEEETEEEQQQQESKEDNDNNAMTRQKYLEDSCEHCNGLHSENKALEFIVRIAPPGSKVKMRKGVPICYRCTSIIDAIGKRKQIDILLKDAHQCHRLGIK